MWIIINNFLSVFPWSFCLSLIIGFIGGVFLIKLSISHLFLYLPLQAFLLWKKLMIFFGLRITSLASKPVIWVSSHNMQFRISTLWIPPFMIYVVTGTVILFVPHLDLSPLFQPTLHYTDSRQFAPSCNLTFTSGRPLTHWIPVLLCPINFQALYLWLKN